MQIFTIICIVFVLLSPIFFWMYILQSFPNLGVGRKQFFIGMGVGSITTLPLVYYDFWLFGDLIKDIFFSFSYISQSFLGLEIFFRIFLFFALIFFFIALLIYITKHNVNKNYVRTCLGFSLIIAVSSLLMYVMYNIFGNSVNGETVTSGDFIFQGFSLIFGYYIIISLLEEGLKYFGNTQAIFKRKGNFYKVIGYACVVGLGFAFFENLLYTYNHYLENQSLGGIFQLVFFRSVFTVSLHILCAILLAAGLYVFTNATKISEKIYFSLFCLGGGAIFSHAFFDIALTYGYIGVIYFYIFALYVTVVYVTRDGGVESELYQ